MKVLLVGYGAMNERVARLAEERGHSIAGIITKSDKHYPYPSFKIEEEWPAADVIIDFSHRPVAACHPQRTACAAGHGNDGTERRDHPGT